jgi:hypothetical protein
MSKPNIGNNFISPPKRAILPVNQLFQPAVAINMSQATMSAPMQPAPVASPLPFASAGPIRNSQPDSFKDRTFDLLRNHTIGVYALLILAISLVVSPVAQSYFSSSINLVSLDQKQPLKLSSGINMSVPSGSLAATEQSITSQTATINLGSQTVPISPATIKSWLQVTPSLDGTQDSIHIDSTLISSSLMAQANSYTKAALNQVTITRSDGTSEVAVGGQNGLSLSDPSSIPTQATAIAKNLLSSKGFQVNAPLSSVPFQAWTAANFTKLIVTDLNSKKMYVYQNGQIVNSFLVSAGKPSTPSPVGEFHIWAKLTNQTMTGPGYVQPNVPWVNYFDHSGDAIHGVYWRPASVFGNVNTSHGCVGLPVSAAEWVYNWAPIGTTVINTPN